MGIGEGGRSGGKTCVQNIDGSVKGRGKEITRENQRRQVRWTAHLVHQREYFLHTLFGRALIFRQLDHVAHHFVNGSDNLGHFLFGNEPIAVEIVERKGP